MPPTKPVATVNMAIAATDAALVLNVIKLQNMRLVGRARHMPVILSDAVPPPVCVFTAFRP
jgi:hypothetical protein